GERLEYFPHALCPSAEQTREREVDLGGFTRVPCLEHGRSFVNPEILEQITLRQRAVALRPHALRTLRQRLEIDVRGQIGLSGRSQRIGERMAGDRLQG